MQVASINITAAWAVDREFVYIVWGALGLDWAPFGEPLGSLWPSFGSHLGPFGCPWLPLGSHLGSFGPPLGPLGARAPIWIPFSEQMLLKYRACAQNLASRNSPADPAEPAESPEVVSRTAARTPPPHAPGARMTVV